ncbi:hypothetical protein EYF80_020723 [Liparis tanakae]|uniref:Uncharacterized protein n=1 Tax=Liparis tanakae TaxID=230148 RepID=A0A4Z2HTN7_9TELE|nr:hypothetical protein EYF80_020723 [Liparis tanakae]
MQLNRILALPALSSQFCQASPAFPHNDSVVHPGSSTLFPAQTGRTDTADGLKPLSQGGLPKGRCSILRGR